MAVEIALIFTGKLVVTAISFGRWRGENLASAEARIYGPAGALSFKHEGKRIITANGLLFVGICFYVVLVFLLFCFSALV